MPNFSQLLVKRLSSKGLTAVECSRLIKDVMNIMDEGEGLTVALLNRELQKTGWKADILDEFSFELILCLGEKDYGH